MKQSRVKRLEKQAKRNRPLDYSRVIGFTKFEEDSYTTKQLSILEEQKSDPNLKVVQFIIK